MMYSNVIVGITISRGSFVLSQSRVKVSTSLTNIGRLAVGAIDLVDCSLSVMLLGSPLSFTLVSNCRNVVVGLWATRMLYRAVGSVRWSRGCP